MCNRDGGPRILQMFQIQQNTDLPPESCENKSPVTHSGRRKRRKMGPVSTTRSRVFSPARETKWKSMWRAARINAACFLKCFMFFECPNVCRKKEKCMCERVCVIASCGWVRAHKSTERPLVRFFCACESCRVSVFWIFYSPLASCSLYRLPLSVCPLGQRLWPSAMKRPFSGSSGVCWKIPTWTQ